MILQNSLKFKIVKLSNLQFNKLRSGIKNGTEATLKILLNFVGNSNNEDNFPHKLLLTNIQVLKLGKAFTNSSSANIKLSKTQLNKIAQPGEVLSRLLGALLKTGLSLIGNVLKPLAKNVLTPQMLLFIKCLDLIILQT